MKILRKKNQIPNDFLAASRKHFTGDTSPHVHEFFELEYVIGGEGICEIDGKPYAMTENVLFLLNPSNTHAVRAADAELINVMFRCEYSDDFFALPILFSLTSPQFSLSEEDGKLILALFSELIAVYERDMHYARLLLECILRKLSHLSAPASCERLSYIRHAMLFITEHFREGITLERTAAHIGLTASYFSDLFKRETGMGFREYLDGVRFSHAQNLLVFTDIPVCEIPRYSGFYDYANFSRRFRTRYGVTPTEYRRKGRRM
ncbi:MAG: helix-turn-helix transcriptional regulator [Clostridia bacterium]|nr:helix-turn-helix transcriptional regulator [Clostridia bacterium]